MWTGLFPLQGFADAPAFPPREDMQQRVGYRLALKAPDGGGAGMVEEKSSPNPPVSQQRGMQPVAPEKTGPPLPPSKPSEQIPADQAVDFPADI
jgi:hypothetical protein